MNPLLLTDGYKLGHREQYPNGTTLVYSNWTPRKSRIEGIDNVVFFGLQYFIKEYLIKKFNEDFFDQPKVTVVSEYKKYVDHYLGVDYDTTHIEALHDLGYLPIEIKALPEGTEVPIRVPMFTLVNTRPDFFWLTNYLETLLSNIIWQPCTSATIAKQYQKILSTYASQTDKENLEFITWQGHDFSMRGMSGTESSILSGMGHALSFSGSDTLPVAKAYELYYNADVTKELVIGSVNATEHSVMCAGSKDDEIGTFKRLLETYPTGILSVVSDTWDLWKVLTEYLPKLKKEILEREGKLVIRPDSGDPVDIICGCDHKDPAVAKGVIELLWDEFGGIINDQGYKVLNPKIGAIYGDSITIERATQICERLKQKGFASTNVVLGIGSFTYQYNTRDTFGFAMKATYVEVKGEGREIFKDPITDDGTKKSAKGLIQLYQKNGTIGFKDQVSIKEENEGLLNTIFKNGKLVVEEDLSTIRKRLLQ
ncbi:nicotinate phosphoribosyltransferase [Aquimarina sp. 2201CG5-10]|uniref:nicotinate phosphoribosyltransferase n=1 Tax=Aquimarina callyspongiae TaxID=3098150 RepID=UPI002AB4231C|nr:nicotinate phosphoribosyltransferase [Aquimarina sp. 2201CG5-10]MDY8137751.1 nicotinate phosphoribosyltransferase [Aquimarina sp. 2201CG5-10]